jgi:hypothetical protein
VGVANRRETFLRRVVSSNIEVSGAIAQGLSCGHLKYVLALTPNKDGLPVLPKRRYCDECAVAAERRRKRRAVA